MLIGIDASRANVVQRTGTERYAWEVISRLVALLPEHRVRLYVREPLLADWPPFGNNVQVRVLRWKPGVLWSHLRFSWELLWHTPDVLFVPADTVPIIHPKNTITTIHDVAFERFPELYRGKTVQRTMTWLRPVVAVGVRLVTLGKYGPSERDYHRWSVRHAIRSCRTIITVSEFTKRELIEIFHVAPDRITVIPLGIHSSAERPLTVPAGALSLVTSLGIHRPYMVFIGRLEVKKNIQLLIEAYHRYREQTADPVDLVLIGTPGFGWPTAVDYITLNNLEKFIHVLGWQSDAITNTLHVQSKTFIFISQYEGFGLPALESLSIGVPVVASRLGSLPEVLGSAAYFVDPTIEDVARGMEKVTTDEKIRAQLIVAGKLHVRRYSWARTAEQTRTILLCPPLPKPV